MLESLVSVIKTTLSSLNSKLKRDLGMEDIYNDY